MSQSSDSQDEFASSLRIKMSNRHFHRRYQSVEMEPMDDSSDNSNQTWLQDGLASMQLKRSEMNKLIMDYLVHEGFKEAAERFREEAGIEPVNLRLAESNAPQNARGESGESVNKCQKNNITTTLKKDAHQKQTNSKLLGTSASEIDKTLDDWPSKVETPEMMDKRIEVRQLIEEGDILKSQTLINLYYPELLDNHKNVYFRLQQQHLIEMIRQQRISDVLAYVHDHLSVDELGDLTEMERTLALLAYEKPDKSPYASLLQPSQRLQLASDINDIILQETTGNVEQTKPRLVTLLTLLFWTQSELERKKIQFPKMTDLVNGTIIEPRH